MKAVKFAYKKWAEKYDEDSKFNPGTEMEKDLIIPLLKPAKKDIILDIGCGTGRFTIPIAKRCKKVIGIDFSEDMLLVAKRKSKNIKNTKYRKLDIAKKLPFKNNSFDKIVCTLVVSHIKNLEKFIKEIQRILKKGGIFVYDDFAANLRHPFKTMFDDILMKMRKKGFDLFTWHTINNHVNVLHKLGFNIECIKFSRVDNKIKHTLSKVDFKRNKGRTLGVIFKVRKSS